MTATLGLKSLKNRLSLPHARLQTQLHMSIGLLVKCLLGNAHQAVRVQQLVLQVVVHLVAPVPLAADNLNGQA